MCPSNLDRILSAATEVFARNGLSATLADVATAAGVGVGTVYRRFANKDELIYEVYADRVHATEKLAQEASDARDVWAGFVRFFEETIRDLATDRGLRELTTGGFTELVGWARGTSPERLVGLLDENHRVMGRHLTKLTDRAKATGRLRTDFHPTDMMLVSLAVQSTIDFGGAERPELYRRVLTFMLDGLAPDRPTPLPEPPLTEAELLTIRQN
ncbi:MAG TPA: helix-turn-helix domain-containing protein [Pseudonocardiaceae bacterium]